MKSRKQDLLLMLWIFLIYIQNKLVTSETSDSSNITTTTEKTLEGIFREIRKNQTTKDADMIIKMTRDFVVDMQQKMSVIKRIERSYSSSVEYHTGGVLTDITSKFEHMCNLYKQFATVRRYVFQEGLDNRYFPSPDVVPVFQLILSDYNQILMQIELFKLEMHSWDEGADTAKSRDLVKKQMAKFGNLPAKLTPPRIIAVKTIMGNEPEKEAKPKNQNTGRRWESKKELDYQQKWSGELDGVNLEDR